MFINIFYLYYISSIKQHLKHVYSIFIPYSIVTGLWMSTSSLVHLIVFTLEYIRYLIIFTDHYQREWSRDYTGI